MVDHFLYGLGARAHSHDHPVGIRMTHIIKKVIFAAGKPADFFHVFDNNGGNSKVMRVAGLPVLEKDVRILCRAPDMGMLGVHGPGPEFAYGVIIDQPRHFLVINQLDLLYLA